MIGELVGLVPNHVTTVTASHVIGQSFPPRGGVGHKDPLRGMLGGKELNNFYGK